MSKKKELKLDNQHIDITFTKGGVKPSAALMKRFDGSEVFVQYKSEALVIHDLAHFALESVLMIRSGFYWLINSGLQPADFEISKADRSPELRKALENPDNIAIEFIVNQLVTELNSGRIDNFLEVLDQGLSARNATNFTFPFTDIILDDVRELFETIIEGWSSYKEGFEKKVLVFFPDDNDRLEDE